MKRKRYATDLNDAEWQLLEAFVPPAWDAADRPAKFGGRPREVNIRNIGTRNKYPT